MPSDEPPSIADSSSAGEMNLVLGLPDEASLRILFFVTCPPFHAIDDVDNRDRNSGNVNESSKSNVPMEVSGEKVLRLIALVCRSWYRLARDETLWQKLAASAHSSAFSVWKSQQQHRQRQQQQVQLKKHEVRDYSSNAATESGLGPWFCWCATRTRVEKRFASGRPSNSNSAGPAVYQCGGSSCAVFSVQLLGSAMVVPESAPPNISRRGCSSRQRDDVHDDFTESMVTAGSDGVVRFWSTSKTASTTVPWLSVSPGTNGEEELGHRGSLGFKFDEASRVGLVGRFDGTCTVFRDNSFRRATAEDDWARMSIRQLKELLSDHKIDIRDCFEKTDLIQRLMSLRARVLPATTELAADLIAHAGVVVGTDIQGRLMATSGHDGVARVWRWRLPEEEPFTDLTADPTSPTATSPYVIPIQTFAGHLHHVNALQLVSKGCLLWTCSGDTTARLWDVESGKEIRRISAHDGWIWNLHAQDRPEGVGRDLLVTGSVDGTGKVWDVRTHDECVARFGHVSQVSGIRAAWDAQKVVTTCFDGGVRMWDLRASDPHAAGVLVGRVAIERATRIDVEPTGERCVVGDFQGKAYVFRFDE